MLSLPELPSILYYIIRNIRIVGNNLLSLQAGDAVVLATFFCLTGILLGFAHLLWRNRLKSGLFVALTTVLFFSYGDLFEFFMLRIGHLVSPAGLHVALVAFSVFVLAIAPFLLNRTTIDLSKIVRILNVFLLIFALLAFIDQGLAYRRLPVRAAKPSPPAAIPVTGSVSTDRLPDVYHIVFDAFAREDILRDLYRLDTASFTRFLNEKGFFVAERSTANYPFTFASILSTLECRYINDLLTQALYPADIVRRLENNPTMAAFSQSGYNIVLYKSGYYYTTFSFPGGLATDQIPGFGEFSDIFLGRTLLAGITAVAPASIVQSLPPWLRELCSPYAGHRDRIRYVFDTFPRLQTASGPVFAFAHIVSPHAPNVFDEAGNDVEPPYCFTYSDPRPFIVGEEYKHAYNRQTLSIQEQIRNLVTALQDTHASRPLVIVLSSDHGPGYDFYYGNIEGSNLKERFSNFLAVYFSDKNYARMGPAMTPVNLYRIIRSKYLEEDLPNVEDRNYLIDGTTGNPPFATETLKIIDITDKLQ